ncbi:SHOCT-like domain-containing protein [Cryptosporangium sp. NPDC051539]|uniref:SHOCT-like domain-containing protein n=1 Tax=Cryptosporangium sp. NPDC051539 TaxID=3363962 RepID=UPI00379B4F3C
MNEQRRQILEMLAEGKITADEAERLIAALERAEPEAPAGAAKPRPKYLRVMVDDHSDGGSGRINVRVPIQLLRAGVRITSLIPPQALLRANEELSKSGVPIDLTALKPQHIEDLVEHLDDLVVDVDEAHATVKVFCE